jgi:DNA-binding MarR family transcriptional regulator
MAQYELLKKLLEKVETYEKLRPHESINIADFAQWLAHDAQQNNIENEPLPPPSVGEEPSDKIGGLVGRLFRYAKTYSKIALKDTPLQTVDEFVYLVTLAHRGGMTKSELIEHNIQERTTGIEIIKRLVRANWILEQDDPDDRRSRRLTLTPEGVGVLRGVFGKMQGISKIVLGNLNRTEQRQLVDLLNRLDHFHHEIFMQERLLSFTHTSEKSANFEALMESVGKYLA